MAVSIGAKIEISASEANRELQILLDRLTRTDSTTLRLVGAIEKLETEQKRLAKNTREVATEDMKVSSAKKIRISDSKKLSQAFTDETAKIRSHVDMLGKESKALNNLHSEAIRMNKDFDSAKVKADALSSAMNKLSNSTMSYSNSVKSAKTSSNTLKKSFEGQSKIAGGIGGAFSNMALAVGVAMGSYTASTKMAGKESQTLNNTTKELSSNTEKLSSGNRRLAKNTQGAAKSMDLLNEASSAVSHIWRIVLGYYMAKQMADIALAFEHTAENVELLGKKMAHFTNEANSLDTIVSKSIEIGYSIQDLGKIVTRFSITTKGMYNTEEMTKWAETLVRSARAAGTSTMELNSALIQLSQSFSAGRLMGDEYRSISENLPMLKQALEQVFEGTEDAGVGLKKLSSQGKITTEVLIQAFDILGVTIQDIPGTINTIDAALSRFNSSWQIFTKEVNDGSTSLKDFINIMAGILTHISENQAAIDGLSRTSKKLSKETKEYADIIRSVIDVLKDLISLVPSIKTFAAAMAIAFGVKAAAALWTWAKAATAAGLAMTTFSILAPIGVMIGKFVTLIGGLPGVLALAAYGLFDLHQGFVENREAARELSREVQTLTYSYASLLEIYDNIDAEEEARTLIALTQGKVRLQAILNEKIATENLLRAKVAIGEMQNESFDWKASSAEMQNLLSQLRELQAHIDAITDKTPLNLVGEDETDKIIRLNKELHTMFEDLDKDFKAFNEMNSKLKRAMEIAFEIDLPDDELSIILNKITKEYIEAIKATKTLTAEQRLLKKFTDDLVSGLDPYVKLIKQVNEQHNEGNISLEKKNALLAIYEPKTKKAIAAAKALADVEKIRLELFKKFHPELNKYLEEVIDITKAYQQQMITLDEMNEKIARQKEIMDASEICKTAQKEATCIEDMRASYDAVYSATRDFEQAQRELEIAVTHGGMSQELATKKLQELRKEIVQAQADAGDLGSKFRLMWGEFAEGIDENVKGLFSDILKSEADAWDNFMDRIKDSWTDMLADMAYEALLSSITIGLNATGGGSVGGGSIASTQTGIGTITAAPGTISAATNGIISEKTLTNSLIKAINANGTTSMFSSGNAFSMNELSNVFSGTPTYTSPVGPTTGTYGFSNAANAGAAGLTGGYVAGQIGGWDGVAAGSLVGVGTVAASGALFGAAGTAGALGGGTMMGGAGAALAAMGPVGWAALAVGIILSSGVLNGDSDYTPDLNIGGFMGGDGSGTYINSMGSEGNGTYDPVFGYKGTFGTIGVGTQHDAFDSEEAAMNFVNAITSEFAMMDTSISDALGKKITASVVESIGNIQLPELKGEESEDWTATLENQYRIIFGTVMNKAAELTGNEDWNIWSSLEGDMKSIVYVTTQYVESTGELRKLYEEMIDVNDRNANIIAKQMGNWDAVNSVMEMLGVSLYSISVHGVEAANSLVEAAGGLINLANLTGYFFETFYTAQEQGAYHTKLYADTIKDLNEKYDTHISTATSGYRYWTEAILNNKDASADLVVELLALGPVVTQVIQAEQAANVWYSWRCRKLH